MQPRPFAHLPRVGAACVDHMFAGDGSFVGLNLPFAAGQLRYVCCPTLADDFDAFLPRARGHCHCHIGRVHVTVVGGVQCAYDPVEIVERVSFCDLVWPDKFDVEAQRPAHGQGMPQPVHLVLRIGQAKRSAAVPCNGLARLSL